MHRGQVSIDFMLAVVAALVFIGSLGVFGGHLKEMQTATSVETQLHAIGLDLSEAISTFAVLKDAQTGGATLSYKVPKIGVLGKPMLQDCNIVIVNGDDLNLSYNLVDETGSRVAWTTVKFKDPGVVTITPALSTANPGKCGESILLSD